MRNVQAEAERISKAVSSLAALKAARRAQSLEERLFIGVFPRGISYCDRAREEHGDYMKLAFLPYSTLRLEVYSGCSAEMRSLIEKDAATIHARKGEQFQVSTCGQTVTLGGAA